MNLLKKHLEMDIWHLHNAVNLYIMIKIVYFSNTDNANTYEMSSFMLISNSSNIGSFFSTGKRYIFFYSWNITALDSNHILFPPSEPECFFIIAKP